MVKAKLSLLACMLILCQAPVLSQSNAYTPKTGSDERKQIMDALRVPVEKELKQPAIFKADHLKVKDGWAFLRGKPLRPGGQPMDYRGTAYQQAIKEGMFDDGICALLRRQEGKWRVVEYVIGATDAPYDGWDQKHKAPAEIFK